MNELNELRARLSEVEAERDTLKAERRELEAITEPWQHVWHLDPHQCVFGSFHPVEEVAKARQAERAQHTAELTSLRADQVRLREALKDLTVAWRKRSEALHCSDAKQLRDASGWVGGCAHELEKLMAGECSWPGCERPALCESGSFGNQLVCAKHFAITNGTSSHDGQPGASADVASCGTPGIVRPPSSSNS